MKKMFPVALAILMTLGFVSCKKDGENLADGKNVKVEITTTGFSSGDVFICFIAPILVGGNFTEMKINGTVRSNEVTIQLDEDDFVDNKLTIETTERVNELLLTMGGSADGSPFTITVSPNVNGTAREASSFTVNANDNETKQYSY